MFAKLRPTANASVAREDQLEDQRMKREGKLSRGCGAYAFCRPACPQLVPAMRVVLLPRRAAVDMFARERRGLPADAC